MSTPYEDSSPDDVAEADWADQHVAADPGADEVLADSAGASHTVTTEADTADLAEQDTLAYVADEEV